MIEPQQPLKVQLVKKAWYKRWYGILFIIILLLIFIGVITSSGDEEEPSPTFSPAAQPGDEAPAGQPAAQEEKMLQKFEGQSNHTTRPFTVPDKWEVRWNFTGTGHHSIVYYHGDGEYGDLLLNESGKPTQGTKFIPRGGDYYLEISGSESWTVEVWQVP